MLCFNATCYLNHDKAECVVVEVEALLKMKVNTLQYLNITVIIFKGNINLESLAFYFKFQVNPFC